MTTPRKARQVATSVPFPTRLGRLALTASHQMTHGTMGAFAVIATLWALGTVLPIFNGLAHTLAHHGCGLPVSLNFLALGVFAFVLAMANHPIADKLRPFSRCVSSTLGHVFLIATAFLAIPLIAADGIAALGRIGLFIFFAFSCFLCAELATQKITFKRSNAAAVLTLGLFILSYWCIAVAVPATQHRVLSASSSVCNAPDFTLSSNQH